MKKRIFGVAFTVIFILGIFWVQNTEAQEDSIDGAGDAGKVFDVHNFETESFLIIVCDEQGTKCDIPSGSVVPK